MTEIFQPVVLGLAGIFTVAWAAILIAKVRILRTIPRLRQYPATYSDDEVSIIVPVRNEEKTIKRCIQSLLSQTHVSKQIIVVDDGSTDSTWDVVRGFSADGVAAVSVGATPEGWVGKTWACNVGFRSSKGEWLLFTDADTEFSEMVLARALNAAKSLEADMLTLCPRFRFNSLLHKATMPLLLTGLYFLGKPHKITEGKSAFAFGSFLLIRRQAYQMIGGHTAVRDAILEDRAIAIRIQRAGLRPVFIDATEMVASSWNDDSKSLWNGMSRLFIPLSLKANFKQFLTYFLLTAVCLTVPLVVFMSGNYVEWFLCYVAAGVALGHESQRNSASFWYGFLWPAGVAALTSALLVAFYKSRTNPTVEWRGRRYSVNMGELHEVASVC